jgi:prepilin-type N-terminal cleavage/methylation domain-containing protein
MTLRRASTPGFTLIELLTSMVVGSLILLLAATMLGSSGEQYERVGGGVAAEREARAVLFQLGSDLSTAQFHQNGEFESSPLDWPADRLGFLCLQPADAQSESGRIGDLCAVHYYLTDLAVSGKTTRVLMRGFRESADTFRALREGELAPLFTPRDAIDEPIAFGVVSFEARPKTRDVDGNWVEWTADIGSAPEALDVRLVIARRDLAGRLRQPADWDGAGTTGHLLGQPSEAARNSNLEIYASRIRFGSHESH